MSAIFEYLELSEKPETAVRGNSFLSRGHL